jgi:hypothetical protein
MDLVPSGYDQNGIFYQPRWKWQIMNPGQYPVVQDLCHGFPFDANAIFLQTCTTQQLFVDYAWTCMNACISGRYPGHINWCPATYEGTIYWDKHSPSYADDDYNFGLVPSVEGAGFTRSNRDYLGLNPGALHLEFDSDETIDQFWRWRFFAGSTSWWHQFHDAVDNDNNRAHSMVDGRRAIVTGLIGLDSYECSFTEIHPVWSIAIEVQPPHLRPGADASSRWAIFVRNWGNEGWCSYIDWRVHYNNNAYTFILPYPKYYEPDSLSFRGFQADFLTNYPNQVVGPWVRPVHFGTPPGAVPPGPPPQILVSFTGIPDPNAQPLIEGDIILDFNLNPSGSARKTKKKKEAPKPLKFKRKDDEALEFIKAVENRLPPDKKKIFRQRLEKGTKIKSRNLERKAGNPKPATNEQLNVPLATLLPQRPNMVAYPSLIRQQKNQALYNALYEAFDGKIPKELWFQEDHHHPFFRK